jgi:hypothetical protein
MSLFLMRTGRTEVPRLRESPEPQISIHSIDSLRVQAQRLNVNSLHEHHVNTMLLTEIFHVRHMLEVVGIKLFVVQRYVGLHIVGELDDCDIQACRSRQVILDKLENSEVAPENFVTADSASQSAADQIRQLIAA